MKALLIIIATALLLLSCKKDKVDVITPDPHAQFNTPTTTGSYWIYHSFKVDTNGVETLLADIDSVSILGDTIINNINYSVRKITRLMSNNSNFIQSFVGYERDSSGYRINQDGEIIYSFSNFTDTISKSDEFSWKQRTKMFKDIPVNTPVGSFTSLEARRFYFSSLGGPATNCGDEYFTLSTWYVEGIGKVKGTTGFVTDLENCGNRIEYRLVEYYIAP